MNLPFKRTQLSLCVGLIVSTGYQANAAEDQIEEILVSSALNETVADTVHPVTVLSGDELRQKVGNTLGETLANEPGINIMSYGTGVGQPIIRGQTGNRVSVLQNSVGVTDMSAQSPDHANAVEPVLADRIEVLRGPATLLYGSGAIGGIVNVIDNRIPSELVEETNFVVEQSHNTVNNEDKTVVRLDASAGSFGFHFDGFKRKNDNVDIDGWAIDEFALEELEEKMHEAIEAMHGDDHDDHDDDHDDEHEGHHEEVEFIRLDMESTRYDVKGGYNFDGGFFETFTADIAQTDYQHGEVEYFEDGGSEVGTLYESEATASRFVLNHRHMGGWSGAGGAQINDSEFSATGEEAFISKTDINSVGFFAVEQYESDNYTIEFGARFENNELDNKQGCDFDDSAMSFSGSLFYNLTDSSSLIVGAARSERAPTVEELFSNVDNSTCGLKDDHDYVLHAATNLFELGNADLDNETSNNIELGYRIDQGAMSASVNAYYNQVDDYIALTLTGEEHMETPVAAYMQKDATFKGLEASVSFNILENGSLSFFGDMVDADFDKGGNLPRIPANKIGTQLAMSGDNWTTNVRLVRVDNQDDVSRFENETDGYTLLSVYADYDIQVRGDSELKLFLRGNNLMDEEVRNHASMLKNFAPEPGRSLQFGIRYDF